MKGIISALGAGMFMLSSLAFAADETTPAQDTQDTIKPTLILNHIKFGQSGESDGDELYLSLTVYRANQPAKYNRIPEKPIHWTSEEVDKVKQMPVWSGPIKNGESVLLLIDLMESDDSPLNPDDIIGTASIKFKNNNGVLETKWGMPNRMGGPTSIDAKNGKVQRFMFVGEGSVYEVYLSELLNYNPNMNTTVSARRP